MDDLKKRLRGLETRFGANPDGELLTLIARNDYAELERRIAARAGSPGMLNVGEVLLAGEKQLAELSPEQLAALDRGEGNKMKTEVTIQ